jgi:hypothetical protein
MARRIVISVVLAVVLVVIQLLVGTPPVPALITGAITLVVAYLVLLVSDRWFDRVR